MNCQRSTGFNSGDLAAAAGGVMFAGSRGPLAMCQVRLIENEDGLLPRGTAGGDPPRDEGSWLLCRSAARTKSQPLFPPAGRSPRKM